MLFRSVVFAASDIGIDDVVAWGPDACVGLTTASSFYWDRTPLTRAFSMPFMEAFDAPALQASCARRESSTHAPQALELLNGRLANELAGAFARRLEAECGTDQPRIVARAYALATGRAPTEAELKLSLTFLREQPLREFALSVFNLNAFLHAP